MERLESLFAAPSFVASSLTATSSTTSFAVKEAANFAYTDPIDGSISKNQGLYVRFVDGSRIVFRLSGTGSSGATIRLYVEKYSKDEAEYERDTQEGLKPLIEVALKLSQLVEITGRKEPTVITVSFPRYCCPFPFVTEFLRPSLPVNLMSRVVVSQKRACLFLVSIRCIGSVCQ